MQHKVSYNPASDAAQAVTVALTSGVETTVLTLTDLKYLEKTQITVYLKSTLGTASSVKFRYYHSPDGGTTYYQVPAVNGGTGHLDDFPDILDATSPTQAGVQMVTRDFQMSGTTAFKITATATTGTATVNLARVLVRDN